MRRLRTEIAVCIALAALTLGAMGDACWNGFINYDDKDYVTQNPQVKAGLTRAGFVWAFTTTDAANWHPLTWLSLQLDAALFGPAAAWGFHLTNLLLHTANVVLLFLALRRLTEAVWRSALVAALFAVHPTHVESVAWVSERKDVLSGLFAMLTLLAYAWYAERPGWGRYLLVLATFALGLMAKPMLVTLPCVLLLLDYWPLRRTDGAARTLSRKRLGWLLLEKTPLFALTAAACFVTMHAQQHAMSSFDQLPFQERLMNAACAYVGYLGKLIWPAKLAALYPYLRERLLVEETARAVVILLTISGLVLWARRRRYLAAGWLWFLGTLVPVIGLVQVGSQAMADRYTYLPYIGLFIALSWGAADLAARWPALVGSVVVPAALLLGMWGLVRLWRLMQVGTEMMEDGLLDQLLLALTVFAILGWGVGWWLGLWPRRVSLVVPAIAVILGTWTALTAWQGRVWQNSIWLWENTLRATESPDGEPNSLAHNQLGDAYLSATNPGVKALAREHFLKCLSTLPNHAKAHNNLGLIELDNGDLENAEKYFIRAQELEPTLTVAWLNLGVVQERQGRFEEAIATLREALRRDPLSASTSDHLGRSLAALQRWPDAESAFRRAVELEPKRTDYRADLAWALWHLDRKTEAAEQYAAVIALDDGWAEDARKFAWTWATDAKANRRNGFEAVRWAEQACQALGRCDAHYLDTLAAAYAEAGAFDAAEREASEALKVVGNDPELRAAIEQRLKNYNQRRPYRQSV